MYPKRKPEDEVITKLKQLALEPTNKRCFDCGQRGPTYINVTIGSFVCSTCGGLLRGISTPQRIKSISMATFTQVEAQLVEQRGNEVCKSIWLGKWKKPDPPSFDKTSENGRRDFLSDKYEKKLWYVDPSQATVKKEVSESKSLKQIAEKQVSSPISVPRSRGTSVSSNKTPPLIKASPVGMVRSTSLPTTAQPAAQPPSRPANDPASRQPVSQPVPQSQPAPQPPPQTQAPPQIPPRNNGMDLLGPIGNDPFKSASQAATPAVQSFANFDAFALSGGLPAPATFATSAAVLAPSNPNQPKTTAQALKTGSGSDRYAALADLDNTLRSLTFSGTDTNPFATENKIEQPPHVTYTPHPPASQQQQQQAGNPFSQGNWASVNGAQQGCFPQGGVSMINTSSLMSTGQQGPVAPTATPFGTFPAANSVGGFDQQQMQMYQQQQQAAYQQQQTALQQQQTALQQQHFNQPNQFNQQQFSQQQFSQQQLIAHQQMLAAQAAQPGAKQNMYMYQQTNNPFHMMGAQQPTNPFT